MEKTILQVSIFAIAFGLVEASVIVYLRHLLGAGYSPPHIDRSEILFLTPGIAFLELQAAVKIIQDTTLLNIERLRETATLMMLAAIAVLTGKKIGDKITFFFLAFGIWDIFYYIFLRLTIGWPKTLADFDIFFLLPTPWVGPVIVPIVISSILVIGSFFILIREEHD